MSKTTQPELEKAISAAAAIVSEIEKSGDTTSKTTQPELEKAISAAAAIVSEIEKSGDTTSKTTQPELEKAISAAAAIVSEIEKSGATTSKTTQPELEKAISVAKEQFNETANYINNRISEITSNIFDDSQQLVRENIITTGIFKEGEKPPKEILKSIIGVDTSTTTNATHSDIMNQVAKDLSTMTPEIQYEYIIQLIAIVNKETAKIHALINTLTTQMKSNQIKSN